MFSIRIAARLACPVPRFFRVRKFCRPLRRNEPPRPDYREERPAGAEVGRRRGRGARGRRPAGMTTPGRQGSSWDPDWLRKKEQVPRGPHARCRFRANPARKLLPFQMLGEESAHRVRDLPAMSFQREMASVEQPDLGAWNVSPEGLRAGGKKACVVLAPNR